MYPKDLWKTQIMTLGSVAGINTKYQPALNAMYGPAAIREIYGATEGMFGQQLDEKRAYIAVYHGGVYAKGKRNHGASFGFRAVRVER